MILAVPMHHVVHREHLCLTHPAVLLVSRMHQPVQQAPTHHVVLTDPVRLAALLARPLLLMVLTDHMVHMVPRLTVVPMERFHTAHVAQPVTEFG
jgi:hypothetical protein